MNSVCSPTLGQRRRLVAALLGCLWLALPPGILHAQESKGDSKMTQIDFSVEAERAAVNDTVSAVLTAEGAGATPGEIAKQ